VSEIAPALLAWAEHHGRHDLPWQRAPTPYRVWVSEVMLQQTQVATVVPYYQRFIVRFPDVASLAAADLDEVLSLWTGLGYYARARNLHRAAGLIVECHGGCLPEDIATLQALPGIGRSTAGAILALSRSQRHAILDGNARRVIARYFAIEGEPSEPATLRTLWGLAEACTPPERVAEYTQAIMDLGSGVCTRSRPACDACPLNRGCEAHKTGRQHALPSPRRRRTRPQRTAFAIVAIDASGAVLLEQRPANGLWGGLWSLPMFEMEAEALSWAAGHLSALGEPHPLPKQKHAFTHYDLTLHLICVHLQTAARIESHGWFDCSQLADIGLSKAVVRLAPTLMSIALRRSPNQPRTRKLEGRASDGNAGGSQLT
jgi:A/G-specific adenine glycosylase